MERETAMYPIFARHETFHPRFGWLKKGTLIRSFLADPIIATFSRRCTTVYTFLYRHF